MNKKIWTTFVRNKKGQAIFEMMMFLPFFALLFILFLRIISSINLSINQVKATRGYTYIYMQGNSYIPAEDLDKYSGNNFSMAVTGWREHFEGETPVSSCVKLPAFNKAQKVEDKCDEKPANGKSDFIRVYTAYGICGASYTKASGQFTQDYENANTCVAR